MIPAYMKKLIYDFMPSICIAAASLGGWLMYALLPSDQFGSWLGAICAAVLAVQVGRDIRERKNNSDWERQMEEIQATNQQMVKAIARSASPSWGWYQSAAFGCEVPPDVLVDAVDIHTRVSEEKGVKPRYTELGEVHDFGFFAKLYERPDIVEPILEEAVREGLDIPGAEKSHVH